MISVWIVTVFLHAASTVGAGLVGEMESAVGSAAETVGAAAQEAGREVGSAANTAGGAVVGVANQAAVKTADQALYQTGKCDMLIREKSKVEPVVSPIIVRAMLFSASDPSADAKVCKERARDTCIAEMDRQWQDPSGVSDKIVGGLFGQLEEYVCGPPLMKTLKDQEAIRESDPKTYSAHVRETLREEVFTDAWITNLIADHCGGPRAATRLFSASWPSRLKSWGQAPSTSASVASTCFSAATLAVALLAFAGWRRHRQRVGVGEPTLLASDIEGGELSEGDSDAIE